MDTILYIVILVTGFYMAWNIGANDVANAMGTSVGSGALSLRRAVIIAAILEFCGAFFFGSHVSQTMQSGIINPNYFINDPRTLVYGMLAALASTGIWLQLASYYGWPVSTTHSIVGAIVGFGAVVGGVDAIYWGNIGFIISSWILSPCLGGVIGYSLFVLLRKQIFYKPNPIYAAKRLTPLLVFILITILMIIFLSEEMSTIYLKISFNQKILLTIFVGLIGAITSWFLIRHIRPSTVRESHPAIISEMNYSLNKARKHLKKVQGLGDLATHSQIDSLIQEVEGLSSSLRQKETLAEGHSEYLEVEKIFGYLQIVTACMMAFAHGANDVANAIGPLSAAIGILSTGIFSTHTSIPTWALALGGTGIVVGLATWGWRVIETIGKKITELTPTRGFSAEFGAATTIVCASYFGMPISTTHTLVGAIVGVGFARGLEAINLTTTRDILISWVITVPVGAIIAIILFYPIRAIFG